MFDLWFEIKGIEGIERTLVQADMQLQKNAKAWVKDSGELVRDDVRKRVPVFRGITRRNITSRTSVLGTTYQARIGVEDRSLYPQTLTMEGGRRPGAAMPPYMELIPWIRAHNFGSNFSDEQAAFLLARAIKKRGSHNYPKGHQMFELGWNEAQPKILRTAMDIVKVF